MAEPAALTARHGITAADVGGWYVRVTDSGAFHQRWAAVRDLVRVEPTSHGALLRAVWPGAAAREVRAVTPRSFRDPSSSLAGMAHARLADGSRWWIDAESYAEISPLEALLTLAAPVLVLWVLLALAVVVFIVYRRRRTAHPERKPESSIFNSLERA